MMIRARIFFLIVVAVGGAFLAIKGLSRGASFLKPSKELTFHFALEEKPIVIMISSHNNEEYIEKNLWSVLEQSYKNYRVVFIDDASTDRTFEKAKLCIETFGAEEKVACIRNVERYQALYNLYYLTEHLSDETIVVTLNGSDWFAHENVLKEINRYYSDPNVWMAYSQYVTYPQYEKSHSYALHAHKKHLRGQKNFPEIRTFYAGLFKHIQLKDLLYEGEFFKESWNLAILFPLWEMAEGHTVFIPDVLYVSNQATQEEEKIYSRYIASLPPYPNLNRLHEEAVQELSALILFSENRPLQLFSFLESLSERGRGFYPVHVLYDTKSTSYEKGYDIVKERFKNGVTFHRWNGKEGLIALMKAIKEEHITFAKDTMILQKVTEAKQAISLLEKTGAYGVYFDLGLNIEEIPSKLLPLEGEGFVWDFRNGKKEWGLSQRLSMSLHRKESLLAFLARMEFSTMRQFEKGWEEGKNLHQIGLCFTESQAVNLPMQVTKLDTEEKTLLYTEEELNDRLLEGYKIDIQKTENLQNYKPEIEFYPQFIPQ